MQLLVQMLSRIYTPRVFRRFSRLQYIFTTVTVILVLWWIFPKESFVPSIPCPQIWTRNLTQSRQNLTAVRPIYCDRAFKGDKEEILYTAKFKWCLNCNRINDENYIEITKNCDAFKKQYGYLDYNITKEESDFPIAFSILMHENVEQAERLLRMIYRPQNFYCIHVDLKASDTIQAAIRAITNCFDNVILPIKQVGVRWAEYTVLEAELACMEALYKASDRWKYFINLTGRDFPLKTNWELVQILKVYNGANDIDGTPHK